MQALDLSANAISAPVYKQAEAYLKTGYANQAQQYRQDDEIEVTTGHHEHLRAVLESLSGSFDHTIRVLDAGCGTGRYFHCIRNASELIGLDFCPQMLDAARSPVMNEQVTIPRISFICTNIFQASFAPGAFDLIYSIGMFALGCPISSALCRKFHDWLAPGGRLFFNVTDRDGKPASKQARQSIRRIVYRFAPRRIKAALDRRSRHPEECALTRPELLALMSETPFAGYRVISQPCLSPLWHGRHLECVAWKGDRRRGRARRAATNSGPSTRPIFYRSLPFGF